MTAPDLETCCTATPPAGPFANLAVFVRMRTAVDPNLVPGDERLSSEVNMVTSPATVSGEANLRLMTGSR